MTQTTLEKTIALLEREISSISAPEKAKAAQRLQTMFSPAKASKYDRFEEDDDLFDNMPV